MSGYKLFFLMQISQQVNVSQTMTNRKLHGFQVTSVWPVLQYATILLTKDNVPFLTIEFHLLTYREITRKKIALYLPFICPDILEVKMTTSALVKNKMHIVSDLAYPKLTLQCVPLFTHKRDPLLHFLMKQLFKQISWLNVTHS